MKHIRLLLLIICLMLTASAIYARTWKASELPQPRQNDANNWVANPDGILSPAAVDRINAMAGDINSLTNAQVAVAVIDDFDAPDVDLFASDLFKAWGVGEKGANNGVLLVVAKDARKYAFRTGRGIGGVLPDVATARIAREALVPNLRDNDFDNGVVESVTRIHDIMTTPEAVEEIKSGSARAHEADESSIWDAVIFYLWCCIGLTVILFIWFFAKVRKTAGLERHMRYVELHPMLRILFGLSFVGLGIPFLVYLPARIYLRNLRDGEHLCPNCGTRMHKLDEVHDNEHLTPAQDAEERYDSVDYDVWECPNCGEEDVYAFENADSGLTECPHCHARTARYLRDRVIKAPTTSQEGLAVKEFDCLNCKKISQKPFKLARLAGTASAMGAAAPFIFMGGRHGGGGFGSGFGGGSFGGGVSGGGGTSGGW